MDICDEIRDLKDAFDSFAVKDHLPMSYVQHAAWKLGVYPAKSQGLEVHYCQRLDYCEGIRFYEFCVLISAVKYHLRKSSGKTFHGTRRYSDCILDCHWDVFLGGACNPTTWRFDAAIPFLKENNITFYNPQVSSWTPQLISVEALAKSCAQVVLFVIDWSTRGIASLVEVGYLSGQGRDLVLVMPSESPEQPVMVAGELLTQEEMEGLERCHLFLIDLVEGQGIPVFHDLHVALKCVRELVRTSCSVRDLSEDLGAFPVKHAFVKVGETMATLKDVFSSLDHLKTGRITRSEAEMGLRVVLGGVNCHPLTALTSSVSTFSFPDFCLLFTAEVQRGDEASVDLSNHGVMSCVGSLLGNLWGWFRSWFSQQSRRNTAPPRRPSTLTRDRSRLLPPGRSRRYDIFLGGTCGPSQWRETIAIPILMGEGCTFYNPQVRAWSARLLPAEAAAREHARVLLYVITKDALSTACLVEAAHFVGQGYHVVLYVELLEEIPSPQTGAEGAEGAPPTTLSSAALRDHNRGRRYLIDLANRAKMRVVESLEVAVRVSIDVARGRASV